MSSVQGLEGNDPANTSMEVDVLEPEEVALDYNLRLPSKVKRRLVRQQKAADGTWVSEAEWRKRRGLEPRAKTVRKSTNTHEGFRAGRGVKRPEDAGPSTSAQDREARKKPRPSYAETSTGIKMAVVPVAFPEARLTDEQGESLQEQLIEHVLIAGDPGLQFLRRSIENGALIVTCGNESTREWLLGMASELNLEGGVESGSGVIVGDYKDLLRSTKILIKTPKSKILAQRDPKELLKQIEKQNQVLSTAGWRIVGNKKEEVHQTIILIIDEMSAQELKASGWRVFLGLDRVPVRTLGGYLHDN